MTAKIATTIPTEADLESRIGTLLARFLPGLARADVRHQTTWSIQFGKNTLKKDHSQHTSRSDILLTRDGEHLAIVELKREGELLTSDDDAQGLSYARVLHPRPPIVVVSNGDETRVLETETGNEVEASTITEERFVALMTSAASMAKADVSDAISILMATDPSLWTSAFRVAAQATIDELTGSLGEDGKKFNEGHLFPREATKEVLAALRASQRLTLLEGAPLTGKSHVLRELVDATTESEDYVVFYMSADHGGNVQQELADALDQALGFPATVDEARQWMKYISRADGPTLVLAIDELALYKPDFVKEIADLTSKNFGNKLLVVLAVDDSLADKLVASESGRSSSMLAQRCTRIRVDVLTDAEFAAAAKTLSFNDIQFLPGAQHSSEYRSPWVLGAILHHTRKQKEFNDKSLIAQVPATMGEGLIQAAQYQPHDDRIMDALRDVAEVVVGEVGDTSRSIPLRLESINTYTVRRSKLREGIDPQDKDFLIEQGYMRRMRRGESEPRYVIKTPEILAGAIAELIGEEIIEATDVAALGQRLVRLASELPLGDIIVARAIFSAGVQSGQIPLGLLEFLIEQVPEVDTLEVGAEFMLMGPSGSVVGLCVLDSGKLSVEIEGTTHQLENEEGSLPFQSYSNFHPWLILAHLCHRQMAATDTDGVESNVEGGILLTIGQAKMPIRRPNEVEKQSAFLIHCIQDQCSVVCHKSGIVEPVTQAIYNFLAGDQNLVEQWINHAVAENSFPLIARIHLALSLRIQSSSPETVAFEKRMMDELVLPEFAKVLPLH